MSNIFELCGSILSSVLKQDLFSTWMFEISDVVNFAIYQEPQRFFGIVLEYIIKFSKNFQFFSARSFRWATVSRHFKQLNFSKLINLIY